MKLALRVSLALLALQGWTAKTETQAQPVPWVRPALRALQERPAQPGQWELRERRVSELPEQLVPQELLAQPEHKEQPERLAQPALGRRALPEPQVRQVLRELLALME